MQQIVVVDDGSLDRTAQIVKRQNIKLITLIKNHGKGKALVTGLKYILKIYQDLQVVVLLDGDGQHDPNDLFRLLKIYNKKRPDMLIGNRTNWFGKMPILKMIWNTFISFFISIKTQYQLPDSQSGFRLINGVFLRKIVNLLGQHQYGIETELILAARKKQAKIENYPIKTIYIKKLSKRNHFLKDINRSFDIFKYVITSNL
ncbi:glycosyltransferase family 2 protein [Patescibacteria group bacterium]|nr:glycosyltransferase family 2 protein [Patescibacteria group bacterium]